MKKKKKETRIPHKEPTKKIESFIALELTDLGSDKDPCFGKHYSATADECRRCGDCELCTIVMGQKMHITRAKLEKEQPYHDMDMNPSETDQQLLCLKFIKRKAKKGYDAAKIARLAKKKFPTQNADKIDRLSTKYTENGK